MAFKGADAPPHVIIHGPSGQVFDTGSGNAPVQEAGFAALKNDKLDIAEVVIPTPAGGRWTVEAAPDSSRLVEAIQADGTRPVTATAKVTGSGHDRRLDYTVKGLPAGGRVEFAEAGDGGGGLIGTAKADGRGTVKFHPAGGAPGKREIQAVVYAADGYLTARLPLGKYTAPAPERPARATKLTVRRSGKRLVLRWHGDRSAYTQQVDIRSAAGLNLTRTVRRSTTSIALPAAGTKLVVGVTGTTRSGLAGTAARFNTRDRRPRRPRSATASGDGGAGCREGSRISPAPWRLPLPQARAAHRSSAGRARSPCSMRRCARPPHPRACRRSRSWARRGSARRHFSSTSGPPRRGRARWC
jgi:hypothetical protein